MQICRFDCSFMKCRPLHFSLDRSQSGLRIASTACPVSAVELQRKQRYADNLYGLSGSNILWSCQPLLAELSFAFGITSTGRCYKPAELAAWCCLHSVCLWHRCHIPLRSCRIRMVYQILFIRWKVYVHIIVCPVCSMHKACCVKDVQMQECWCAGDSIANKQCRRSLCGFSRWHSDASQVEE